MQVSRVSKVGVLVALLLAVGQLPRLTSLTIRAQETAVDWSPRTLEVTVFPGSLRQIQLTVSTTRAVRNASLVVVPEISHLFSVATAKLGALEAGTEYRVEAVFDIPASTPVGTYKGTLQVRSPVQGSTRQATISRPLTITIHVQAPTSLDIPGRILLPSSDRIVEDADVSFVVTDEIIVVLDSDVSNRATKIVEIAQSTGGLIVGSVSRTATYQLQYAVTSLEDLELIRRQLQGFDGVKAASHHYLAPSSVAVPHDPEYLDPWDEAAPSGRNWHLEYVRAPSAWDLETGSRSIVISVIDSDFDGGHRDLDDNILSGPALSLESNIHGTHVTGIACAEGNNEIGVTGVAWRCSLNLYPIASLSRLILNRVISVVAAQEAMVQAIDATNNRHIVNMSLQWVDSNQCGIPGTAATLQKAAEINAVLEQPILYAEAVGKDALWVFAAGNECRDVQYASPASLAAEFPNALAVASINQLGMKAGSSNFGNGISVAAPGEAVFSTWPRTCVVGICGGERYGERSGTSMAAPMVTGSAALIWSKHQNLSAADLKECIVTASQLSGRPIAGHDFRVLDAFGAVKCSFARSDTYTMTQGTTLTVPTPGVLWNDTIPLGLTATVDFQTLPPGSLTNLGGGAFSFTPSASFVGSVTFTYLFQTAVGDSNVATVTVQVNPAPPQTITFEFTGVARDFAHQGMSCTGRYTFSPSAPDTDPNPNIGIYRMPAPFSFEARIGAQLIFATTSGLVIRVRNDIGGVEDDYEVVPIQPANSNLHLITRTRDLGAFVSDALPATPPWGGGFWGVFEGSHAGQNYICDILSLVGGPPPRVCPNRFRTLSRSRWCTGHVRRYRDTFGFYRVAIAVYGHRRYVQLWNAASMGPVSWNHLDKSHHHFVPTGCDLFCSGLRGVSRVIFCLDRCLVRLGCSGSGHRN